MSIFFLSLQEKLLLEPYSAQRDVAYIALVPDNDHVLQCALPFFKELTAVYEVNNNPWDKFILKRFLGLNPRK